MIRAIKSRFFNIQPTLSRRELLAYVLLLLLATYVLVPRFWSPGGESFKNWVSARIFRETGGFPVLHHGALYNIYLQLFLFFDYPLSIQLEHFVTHLFTYTCIFLLLCRFLPTIPALLLTCAWIPTIWTAEGGARVLGLGFLALYFRSRKESVLNKGYLPASLGAAALCSGAYILFLLGHIVGTVIKRCSNKEPIVTFTRSLRRKNFLPMVLKAAMVLLVIFTISFQSKRSDNNVHAFNYPWAPFPQKEILTVSSLQFGNWKYVIRNIPESKWIYQDWYFTNEEVFGGASNILQAALYNPKVFLRNIASEVPSAIAVPVKFIFGFYHSFPPGVRHILLLLSWLLVPIIFYRVFQYFKANNLIPHVYSIAFGTSAVVAALMLSWFHQRYLIALLAVGLLMTAYLGTTIQSIINRLRKSVSTRFNTISVESVNSRGRTILFIFGAFLILSGFIGNEWILTPLLSSDGVLIPLTRISIWLIDLLLITGGILVIIKRDFFLSIFKQIKDLHYSNTQSWFTNAVILVMAGSILLSSYNFYGKKGGTKNLLVNPFLLSGGLASVYHELLASLDKQTKVLALEEPWIRSFADVDLDKVFHPLFLPPFEDPSGETEKFLESLDVIWVSHTFSRNFICIATQLCLRYQLHVAPFLEKALENGWTVQEIEGFGKIYRRPISRGSNPSNTEVKSDLWLKTKRY